jgi:hypothetical protein
LKSAKMDNKQRAIFAILLGISILGTVLFSFLSSNTRLASIESASMTLSDILVSFWIYRTLALLFIIGGFIAWRLTMPSNNNGAWRTAAGLFTAGIVVLLIELYRSNWDVLRVLVYAWWPIVLYFFLALALLLLQTRRKRVT